MRKLLAAAFLLQFFLAACKSGPPVIDEELSPEALLQTAQEQVIRHNDYETALFYYEAFIERFPSIPNKIIEAKYEIGFIKYRQKKYDEAKVQFTQIIEAYSGSEAQSFPSWPYILATKLLETIDEKTGVASEEPETEDNVSAESSS